MDSKTLDALKGSIVKWEGVVDGTGADEGTRNCPLCKMFRIPFPYYKQCLECPVMISTGLRDCTGTPYDAFHEMDYDWDGFATTPELHSAAAAELDFLRSLLPADATALPSAQRHSEEP